MKRQKTIDKIMMSLSKMVNLNFNGYQYEVLQKHIEHAYDAGWDEGWRDRTAAHSYRRIQRFYKGEAQEYDSLNEALRSIGGGSKSNLAKACRGKAKNTKNPHWYRGCEWWYL